MYIEPEHCSIVAWNLQDLAREEAEAENGTVLIIVQVAIRAGPRHSKGYMVTGAYTKVHNLFR